jgi:hypothetical protein
MRFNGSWFVRSRVPANRGSSADGDDSSGPQASRSAEVGARLQERSLEEDFRVASSA